MITCPSCNHQNPEGSLQCENCYTPLPASTSCPNCGTSVQTDATFCGQCGFNLQAENPLAKASIEETLEETSVASTPELPLEDLSPTAGMVDVSGEEEANILPETSISPQIISPWDEEENSEDLTIGQPRVTNSLDSTEIAPTPDEDLELPPEFAVASPDLPPDFPQSSESIEPDFSLDVTATGEETEVKSESLDLELEAIPEEENAPGSYGAGVIQPAEANLGGMTQLQLATASLLHLQSDTTIEIPTNLDVVHIGKPNNQIPPDIDVAGFPDSEVVSRIHADIRIEGDIYYIEDMGSSNGTYINHTPLVKGNRHRLRPGDRIALGKGDLVTFIFQLN